MIALRIALPAVLEEAAVTLLWEMGTAGIEVRPDRDDVLALLAYFAVEESERAALSARVARELPDGRIDAVDVPEVDWVARFREGFRPFGVGTFRFVPAWEQQAESAPRMLRMDPGRAFGTGTHETTRLCLLLIERLAAEGPLGRVLDVGAGTGILALAAMRLGAAFAVAADLDPEALLSCRQHAALNGLRLPLVRADGGRAIRPRCFDVLLANLMAPLLIERADELGGLFTRTAVLSGLLVEEIDEVRVAFRAYDPDPRVERMGEWAALRLTRRVA
jgi:ribosomal protein L11 methyltransferase